MHFVLRLTCKWCLRVCAQLIASINASAIQSQRRLTFTLFFFFCSIPTRMVYHNLKTKTQIQRETIPDLKRSASQTRARLSILHRPRGLRCQSPGWWDQASQTNRPVGALQNLAVRRSCPGSTCAIWRGFESLCSKSLSYRLSSGCEILALDFTLSLNLDSFAPKLMVLVVLPLLQGTCKMGAVEQEMTVVDPDMRVKGLQNIRIVDASIFPVQSFPILSNPPPLLSRVHNSDQPQTFSFNCENQTYFFNRAWSVSIPWSQLSWSAKKQAIWSWRTTTQPPANSKHAYRPALWQLFCYLVHFIT
jgi:hypothetical protein